jgi:hypothetical protein
MKKSKPIKSPTMTALIIQYQKRSARKRKAG